MKIAIAEIVQETDTFSPFVADLRDFETYGLMFGEEILSRLQGVGPIGGLLQVASERQLDTIEWVPILRAFGSAGGTITKETLDFLCQKLVSGLESHKPFDGIFLSLHGAAAAEQDDDVEGFILEAVREVVGSETPIICPLDHHANITQRMAGLANALVGHQTQPHDTFDTGRKAAEILFQTLYEGVKPVVCCNKIPLITPQDQFLTVHGPMKEWFDLARDLEQQDAVLDISPYPMQPWLDVEEGSWSVVVHTDNDPELAQALADQMTDKAWELREQFWVGARVEPEDAVRQAKAADEGLIILSDTGDSTYGGAPGDSTIILSELLAQLSDDDEADQDLALVPIVDIDVVNEAMSMPIGEQRQFTLGGKVDNVFSQPIQVTAEVAATSKDVTIQIGERGGCSVGEAVLLSVGNIRIVVMSNRSATINHPILYMHLGVDVSAAKLVVVKTASNFQHFLPWRKQMVRVNSAGMTQSDLHRFEWKKIARPIFPFDSMDDWRQ